MYYDKIRHRHSKVLAATGLAYVEFDIKYHWMNITGILL